MESYHDALRTAINSTITPPISFVGHYFIRFMIYGTV